MYKDVAVKTFNPEDSIPVYKSSKLVIFLNEFDDFPQVIGESKAYYLNGVKHKVIYLFQSLVL